MQRINWKRVADYLHSEKGVELHIVLDPFHGSTLIVESVRISEYEPEDCTPHIIAEWQPKGGRFHVTARAHGTTTRVLRNLVAKLRKARTPHEALQALARQRVKWFHILRDNGHTHRTGHLFEVRARRGVWSLRWEYWATDA